MKLVNIICRDPRKLVIHLFGYYTIYPLTNYYQAIRERRHCKWLSDIVTVTLFKIPWLLFSVGTNTFANISTVDGKFFVQDNPTKSALEFSIWFLLCWWYMVLNWTMIDNSSSQSTSFVCVQKKITKELSNPKLTGNPSQC